MHRPSAISVDTDLAEGKPVPNSATTPAVQRLLGLPRSERRDALAALVVAEFRTTLLMTADDELPMDQSFFDLGMTSLRLTEVKQSLETLLGAPISANSLFNQPTMGALLAHLTGEVLPEVFAVPAGAAGAAGAGGARQSAADAAGTAAGASADSERALLADLLPDLYQV
jgi:acyl carrier protein